jgi:hypothetical protein
MRRARSPWQKILQQMRGEFTVINYHMKDWEQLFVRKR